MTTFPRRAGGPPDQDRPRPSVVLHSDRARTGRVAAWIHRRQLGIFFGLAFLLSWLAWPLVLLNPDSSPLVPFGPLIGAVVTVLLAGGTRPLGRLLAKLGRWRVAFHWYLLALVGPPAVTGLAAALTVASGATVDRAFPLDPAQLVVTLVSTLFLIGLFEELGWRGYALPRLQERMAALPAALLLGVIWAVWHLPELISDPTGQRPAAQFLILVIAQSVFLSWLYNRTAGSLPVVIIAHATVDTVARIVLPSFTGDGYQLIWWYLAGLWIVAAAAVAAIDRSWPRSHHHDR